MLTTFIIYLVYLYRNRSIVRSYNISPPSSANSASALQPRPPGMAQAMLNSQPHEKQRMMSPPEAHPVARSDQVPVNDRYQYEQVSPKMMGRNNVYDEQPPAGGETAGFGVSAMKFSPTATDTSDSSMSPAPLKLQVARRENLTGSQSLRIVAIGNNGRKSARGDSGIEIPPSESSVTMPLKTAPGQVAGTAQTGRAQTPLDFRQGSIQTGQTSPTLGNESITSRKVRSPVRVPFPAQQRWDDSPYPRQPALPANIQPRERSDTGSSVGSQKSDSAQPMSTTPVSPPPATPWLTSAPTGPRPLPVPPVKTRQRAPVPAPLQRYLPPNPMPSSHQNLPSQQQQQPQQQQLHRAKAPITPSVPPADPLSSSPYQHRASNSSGRPPTFSLFPRAERQQQHRDGSGSSSDENEVLGRRRVSILHRKRERGSNVSYWPGTGRSHPSVASADANSGDEDGEKQQQQQEAWQESRKS
jgi:hypothetical protein